MESYIEELLESVSLEPGMLARDEFLVDSEEQDIEVDFYIDDCAS